MTAAVKCRSCGSEPRPDARFCDACGSPIAESQHAEYKQVTVLFADVVHSMDIAAAVGAERLREIMTDLVNRAAVVVQRYGGTVGSFTGDGIMAEFGAPTALEDHAFRACLAALGVQEEAKRLAVDIQERDGVDLRMRVGLNSGQADAAGGPAVLACWGGPEMAVREAQDEAPIARTLPSHTRSDSASSVSSMSVAGSRRCL
jgi:class 3 adenylate cyclase